MTISVWHLLLLLAAPTALGHGVLRLLGIGPKTDGVAYLAWAYMAGSLGAALCNLLWVALAKPFPGTWLLPAQLVLAVALTAATRRRPTAAAVATSAPKESLLLAGLLALTVGYVAFRAVAQNALPVAFGDEADIWAAKAKTLFFASGLDGELATQTHLFVKQRDYPLLNPLLQLGVFESLGRVCHVDNRLPIQAFLAALVLALAAALRQFVRPALAGLLPLLLLGTEVIQVHVSMAMSDHLVMLGLLVAADGWLRWRRTGDAAFFRLAMLGMAFCAFSKTEGSLLCLLAVASACCARAGGAITGPIVPRPRRELWWLALPLGVFGVQRLFNAGLGFQNNWFAAVDSQAFLDRVVTDLPQRAAAVVSYFGSEILLGTESTRLVFAALLLVLVMFPVRIGRSEVAVPALLVVAALCAYQGILIFGYPKLDWLLDTAGSRLSLHVAPIALLGLGMAAGTLFEWVSAGRPRAAGHR